VTSAAKAVAEDNLVIAAVNRCATQNQEQNPVFQQLVKPRLEECGYRSAEALRHPKSRHPKSGATLGS